MQPITIQQAIHRVDTQNKKRRARLFHDLAHAIPFEFKNPKWDREQFCFGELNLITGDFHSSFRKFYWWLRDVGRFLYVSKKGNFIRAENAIEASLKHRMFLLHEMDCHKYYYESWDLCQNPLVGKVIWDDTSSV